MTPLAAFALFGTPLIILALGWGAVWLHERRP